MSFLEVAGLSVLGGLIGSMLGMGGGLILTPLLTTGLGYPIRHVLGANLVSVIATSSGAAAGYVRDRLTNLRIAILLEIATTSGAIIGAYLSALLPIHILYWLFSALLAYSAFSMYQRRHLDTGSQVINSKLARWLRLEGSYYDEVLKQTVSYSSGRVMGGFFVMFGAGGIAGVLGIGAGVFKVLAMDIIMGLPIKVSAATSNFMIGVTAAAGAGVYYSRGDVNPMLAAPVALGILAGAFMGSRLLPRMPGRFIRYLFLPVLLYLAFQMAWKGATM